MKYAGLQMGDSAYVVLGERWKLRCLSQGPGFSPRRVLPTARLRERPAEVPAGMSAIGRFQTSHRMTAAEDTSASVHSIASLIERLKQNAKLNRAGFAGGRWM